MTAFSPTHARSDRIVFVVTVLVLAATGIYMGIQSWRVGEAIRACERVGHVPEYRTHPADGKFVLVACNPPSTTFIVLPENVGPAVTSPRDAPR